MEAEGTGGVLATGAEGDAGGSPWRRRPGERGFKSDAWEGGRRCEGALVGGNWGERLTGAKMAAMAADSVVHGEEGGARCSGGARSKLIEGEVSLRARTRRDAGDFERAYWGRLERHVEAAAANGEEEEDGHAPSAPSVQRDKEGERGGIGHEGDAGEQDGAGLSSPELRRVADGGSAWFFFMDAREEEKWEGKRARR